MPETVTKKVAASKPSPASVANGKPAVEERTSRLNDAVLLLIIGGVLLQLGAVLYFYLNFNPAISRLMPDDSFYYLNTARNIRNGLGSVFSAGEPTNGYHPLWMWLLVASHFVFNPGTNQFVLVAMLLGVAGNLAAALVLRKLLRELGCGTFQQGFGVTLYLVSPWFTNMSLCGEGIQLYFLGLFWFFLAAHRAVADERNQFSTYAWFGVASGFLMLARTDAIFFTGPAFAYLLWRKRVAGFVPLVVAGVVAIVVLSPWLLWSYVRFGTIVQSSSDSLAIVIRHALPPPTEIAYYRFAFYNALYSLNRLLFAVFTQPHFYSNPDATARAMVLGACGLVGLPIAYGVVTRKYARLPVMLWLVPALLMSAYYFLYRFYVQVWHLSALITAALIGLTLLMNIKRPPKALSFGLIAAAYGLTIFSFGSCYFYPQEHGALLQSSLDLQKDNPRRMKIGATDAGYMGFFSKHEVVNLDGVINNAAADAIQAGRFSDYIESRNFDYVSVSRSRLKFYDRNRGSSAAVITVGE